MNTVPESDPISPPWSPCDVLDAAQCCYDLLEYAASTGSVFTVKRDQSYRDLREIVMEGLEEFSCFHEAGIDKDLLPLKLPTEKPGPWDEIFGPRTAAKKFLSALLTAVRETNLDCFASNQEDVRASDMTTPTNTSEVQLKETTSRKKETNATRQRAEKVRKAKALHANGAPITVIAQKLNVSTRSVHEYLKEPVG